MVLIKDEEEDGLLDGPDRPNSDVLDPNASESDVDIEDLEEILEDYSEE